MRREVTVRAFKAVPDRPEYKSCTRAVTKSSAARYNVRGDRGVRES